MPDPSANELMIDGHRVRYEAPPFGFPEFIVIYDDIRDLNIFSCMKEFSKIAHSEPGECIAGISVDLKDSKFPWEDSVGQIFVFLTEDGLPCEFEILTIIELEYERFLKIVQSIDLGGQFAVDSITPLLDEFREEGTREPASEWKVYITCRSENAIFRDLFRVRTQISRASYPVGIYSEDENLLFRFYVPAGRLYAAEMERLFSLFRDWLTAVCERRVRQDGYRTMAGQVYEFFGEEPLSRQELSQKVKEFSYFFENCAEDPSAAVDDLYRIGFDRSSALAMVTRYGKEFRRLSLDLKQERESRLLAMQHRAEAECLDRGANPQQLSQILKFIEELVPEPVAIAPMSVLALSNTAAPTTPAITINQQFISAVGSTVIQNIHGTTNLGFQAKELLELVELFGGQETPFLKAAVHEFEDSNAPPTARLDAKNRLRGFLLQLGGKIEDAVLTALTKYLETKGI